MREIDEYEVWFSESCGNKIREILPLYYSFGAKGVFESELIKRNRKKLDLYRKSVEILKSENISFITMEDESYPVLLKEIFDPPYILYYKGKLPKTYDCCCAVVGARKATHYGRNMAFRTGYALGRAGVVVVSGMAIGADSCAHTGCLEAGGKTVAVLGTGVDDSAKVTSRTLFNRIIENGGCIISEFAPGIPGLSHNYPRRNRIISGMSRAVVVTEAAKRSGTSITAGLALEQGRDVYAIPGNITSVMSEGTNLLIKEGAIPLLSCEAICEELGLSQVGVESAGRKLPELSAEESNIYEAIRNCGGMPLDQLCIETGRSQSEISATLTVMEIKGVVSRKMGKVVANY